MDTIEQQTSAALAALLGAAELARGDMLVVGCSTSEVMGAQIGKGGSMEAAQRIMGALLAGLEGTGVYLAVQCCEHLNRVLVVENECARAYALERVSVVPYSRAGGALAAAAMERFKEPVVVESVKAHAGMDIGSTLIGMQLKHVAVPLRFYGMDKIGGANVTFAKTRPKYVGGPRARYDEKSETYPHL